MGMKGPKAGNIYSSLKSRGLIGGKGKDPMLNCGSPFKVTGEANTPAKFTEEGLSKLKAADIGGKFGEVIDKAVAKKSTPFKYGSNPKTSYGKGGFKKKGCYK